MHDDTQEQNRGEYFLNADLIRRVLLDDGGGRGGGRFFGVLHPRPHVHHGAEATRTARDGLPHSGG